MRKTNMAIGKRMRAAVLAAGLALLPGAWAGQTPPDADLYLATNKAVYSFIDLTVGSGSASVLANIDDGVAPLALPFNFVFYGTSYNFLCVSANGIAYLMTGATACSNAGITDFHNLDLSAAAVPLDAPAIAPFWTDLSFQVPGGGAVYYQSQGAVGSRKYIVQWNNAFPQVPTPSPNPVTFEIELFETSNRMLFQYKTVNLGSGNPASQGAAATIGIRDAAGQRNGRETQWSYDAPVLSNNSALLFSPGYTLISSSQVTMTSSAFAYSRATQLYSGVLTIKNIGSSSITGPFQVLLTGLTSGVTLSSAAASYAGSPFMALTATSLNPGQTATLTLEFKDPSNALINFTPFLFTGRLQ
jgi:hypothetical protein